MKRICESAAFVQGGAEGREAHFVFKDNAFLAEAAKRALCKFDADNASMLM